MKIIAMAMMLGLPQGYSEQVTVVDGTEFSCGHYRVDNTITTTCFSKTLKPVQEMSCMTRIKDNKFSTECWVAED